MSARRLWLLLILPLAGCLAGCFTLRPCDGGGQDVAFTGPRLLNPADIAVPDGYFISVVARDLDLPTGLSCGDNGVVYVTESGDDPAAPAPRLLRLDTRAPDAGLTVVATGAAGPWNGLSLQQGDFYVAEDDADGGRILKIDADGKIASLVENLPSLGDYPAGAPLAGPDNYLYFAQGAATNSGVVGPDNDEQGLAASRRGWLTRNRRFHDIPATDVTLTGWNVQTSDPFTPGGTKVTGAYSPFGEPTPPAQTVPGQVPCTGGIMRVPLAGGPPELVAWGFRDPTGLAFAPGGQLYADEQSYEDRGSRPVSGCGDPLWAVHSGVWYGWPDYFGPRPLPNTRQFAVIAKPAPQFLLANHPDVPPSPAAILPLHGSASGIDFSTSAGFGHVGQAFVAEFGDLAPVSGKLLYPVGFEVVRVDVLTGVRHVFAANKGPINGPASKIGGAGLERPIAVRFDPSGDTLYVLDYGVVTVGDHPDPRPRTGVLWKITRKEKP
jgi:glucose/arabinose dehydrogenase